MEPIIWLLCLHVIVTDKNEWENTRKKPQNCPENPKISTKVNSYCMVITVCVTLWQCTFATCHVVTMVTWLSFLDTYLRRTIPHTASFWITGTPHRSALISQFVTTLATKTKTILICLPIRDRDSRIDLKRDHLSRKSWKCFSLPVSTSRAFSVSCWAKDLTKF